PDAAVSRDVAWDAARGADVLELAGSGVTLRVFFARKDGAVDLVGAEALSAGKRLWRTSYEDFEAVGTARLPRTILFAEGDASYDDGVEIKIKDRTINAAPPEGSFVLTPLPGVAVKDVGCGP